MTDDPVTAAQRLAQGWRELGVDIVADQILRSATSLIGTVDEIVAKLQHAREEYGFSFIVIGEGQIDAFAPIVTLLAGK